MRDGGGVGEGRGACLYLELEISSRMMYYMFSSSEIVAFPLSFVCFPLYQPF